MQLQWSFKTMKKLLIKKQQTNKQKRIYLCKSCFLKKIKTSVSMTEHNALSKPGVNISVINTAYAF